MTNEEAINVLRWLNPPRASKKSFDDFVQATDMAIEALSCSEIPNNSDTISRQQATCEYCHEDSDGYVLSIEKNGHAYIQNGKLALRANGWWGECDIEYCPMCGRKLRGDKHETD